MNRNMNDKVCPRVEHSNWSISVEIWCSDWLRSVSQFLPFAVSLRHWGSYTDRTSVAVFLVAKATQAFTVISNSVSQSHILCQTPSAVTSIVPLWFVRYIWNYDSGERVMWAVRSWCSSGLLATTSPPQFSLRSVLTGRELVRKLCLHRSLKIYWNLKPTADKIFFFSFIFLNMALPLAKFLPGIVIMFPRYLAVSHPLSILQTTKQRKRARLVKQYNKSQLVTQLELEYR